MTTPTPEMERKAMCETERSLAFGRHTYTEKDAILYELNDLQTWATVLMSRQVPKAREAWDLIQRTRIFIIENCGEHHERTGNEP